MIRIVKDYMQSLKPNTRKLYEYIVFIVSAVFYMPFTEVTYNMSENIIIEYFCNLLLYMFFIFAALPMSVIILNFLTTLKKWWKE